MARVKKIAEEVWSREESQERFPTAITPLGWSLLKAPLEATLEQMSREFGVRVVKTDDLVARINSYIYTRKGFFHSLRHWRIEWSAFVPLIFRAVHSLAKATLQSLPGLFSTDDSKRFQVRFVLFLNSNFFRPNWQSILEDWDQNSAAIASRMATPYTQVLDRSRQNASASIDSVDLCLAEQNFAEATREIERDSRDFFAQDFTVYFLKNALREALFKTLVAAGFKSTADEKMSILVQGLPANAAVQMTIDQTRMSESEFLEVYGHLTDNWDIASPLLSEKADLLAILPKSHSTAQSSFEASKKRRVELESELRSHFSNAVWDELLTTFQRLVLIDEDLRALSSRQFPELKKLFSWVAKQPSLTIILPTPSDIVYLELNEIRRVLAVAATPSYQSVSKNEPELNFEVVKQRKKEHQSALQTSPPHEVMRDELTVANPLGIWRSNARAEAQDSQRGVVLSQGAQTSTVRGPVLRITGFDDLRSLTPRHILFVSNPTPVYAPFYQACAGIISETGGALSHGAIVAREFGIPMISGIVPKAKAVDDLVQDQLWADINGETGEVKLWWQSTKSDLSP